MPRASSEPDDEDDQVSELTQHKLKHRRLRKEIDKLKRSNKLKALELKAKDVVNTRTPKRKQLPQQDCHI